MKRFKIAVATFMVAVLGVVAFTPAGSVAAYDPLASACSNGAASEICNNKGSEDPNKLIGTIVNTLLWAVGILSVIMIIVSGIMYTTSAGDAGRVTKAKNTITYAIVGLIVAFLAYAIVNWVLKLF